MGQYLSFQYLRPEVYFLYRHQKKKTNKQKKKTPKPTKIINFDVQNLQ